ncbi:MAG: SEC-C metal-binding domain-containing protein [Thermoanaerobaculia bacterium]
MTTHRNELCACGSGKKTKKCCGAGGAHQTRNRLFAITPIALLAGFGIYHGLAGREDPPPLPPPVSAAVATPQPAPAPVEATQASLATTAPTPAAETKAPVPQPAGPAPLGSVWSEEHGHWHRAPQNASSVQIQGGGSTVTTTTAAPVQSADGQTTLQPQPEGPVPAGKVWSPEHGHWHDAGPTRPPEPVHLGTINAGRVFPRPEGEAPANAVWSTEHGHWHRADGKEQ